MPCCTEAAFEKAHFQNRLRSLPVPERHVCRLSQTRRFEKALSLIAGKPSHLMRYDTKNTPCAPQPGVRQGCSGDGVCVP